METTPEKDKIKAPESHHEQANESPSSGGVIYQGQLYIPCTGELYHSATVTKGASCFDLNFSVFSAKKVAVYSDLFNNELRATDQVKGVKERKISVNITKDKLHYLVHFHKSTILGFAPTPNQIIVRLVFADPLKDGSKEKSKKSNSESDKAKDSTPRDGLLALGDFFTAQEKKGADLHLKDLPEESEIPSRIYCKEQAKTRCHKDVYFTCYRRALDKQALNMAVSQMKGDKTSFSNLKQKYDKLFNNLKILEVIQAGKGDQESGKPTKWDDPRNQDNACIHQEPIQFTENQETPKEMSISNFTVYFSDSATWHKLEKVRFVTEEKDRKNDYIEFKWHVTAQEYKLYLHEIHFYKVNLLLGYCSVTVHLYNRMTYLHFHGGTEPKELAEFIKGISNWIGSGRRQEVDLSKGRIVRALNPREPKPKTPGQEVAAGLQQPANGSNAAPILDEPISNLLKSGEGQQHLWFPRYVATKNKFNYPQMNKLKLAPGATTPSKKKRMFIQSRRQQYNRTCALIVLDVKRHLRKMLTRLAHSIAQSAASAPENQQPGENAKNFKIVYEIVRKLYPNAPNDWTIKERTVFVRAKTPAPAGNAQGSPSLSPSTAPGASAPLNADVNASGVASIEGGTSHILAAPGGATHTEPQQTPAMGESSSSSGASLGTASVGTSSSLALTPRTLPKTDKPQYEWNFEDCDAP